MDRTGPSLIARIGGIPDDKPYNDISKGGRFLILRVPGFSWNAIIRQEGVVAQPASRSHLSFRVCSIPDADSRPALRVSGYPCPGNEKISNHVQVLRLCPLQQETGSCQGGKNQPSLRNSHIRDIRPGTTR